MTWQFTSMTFLSAKRSRLVQRAYLQQSKRSRLLKISLEPKQKAAWVHFRLVLRWVFNCSFVTVPHHHCMIVRRKQRYHGLYSSHCAKCHTLITHYKTTGLISHYSEFFQCLTESEHEREEQTSSKPRRHRKGWWQSHEELSILSFCLLLWIWRKSCQRNFSHKYDRYRL